MIRKAESAVNLPRHKCHTHLAPRGLLALACIAGSVREFVTTRPIPLQGSS